MSETQPPATQQASPDSLWGQSVAAAVSLAGLSSFCYIFGFLCVNAYLGRAGAVVFSLLNAQFLAAGLGFGLFFAVVGIVFLLRPSELPSTLWRMMRAKLEASLAAMQDDPRAASRSFVASYRFSYQISYFIGYFVAYVLSLWFYLLAILGLAYLLCVMFGIPRRAIFGAGSFYAWVATVAIGITLTADLVQSRGALRRSLIPIVIVVFCGSAFFYSGSLYPWLPGWIGGGRPVQVRMQFDPAARDSTAALFGAASANTAEVDMVAETSDYFLVRATNGGKVRLLQIKKDVVKALAYGE